MRQRISTLSLNQKLTLLLSILIIVATLVGAILSSHDWFQRWRQTTEVEYIGRVVDIVSQQPIAGAKVTLDLAGVPPIVYTDSQGIYLFQLAIDQPISGRVRVDARDYEVLIQTINISPEDSSIADLRLTPIATPTKQPSSSSLQSGIWSIDYFANIHLNEPVVHQIDQEAERNNDGGYTIHIRSQDVRTDPLIPDSNFSVRLSAIFHFENGYYEFHCEHRDGCRIFVDGVIWVDAWWDGGGSHDLARDVLEGDHVVSIEYYDKSGLGILMVVWKLKAINTPVASSEDAVEPSSVDGMEMVLVPEGDFLMGGTLGDDDERPAHPVYLDTFWIDKLEITIGMFAEFIEDTGYQTSAEINGYGYIPNSDGWQQLSRANWLDPDADGITNGLKQPVTQVSWQDAVAYCAWAGRRLPTEAEWEKAARGVDGRIYPWGNTEPDSFLARFAQETGPFSVGSLAYGVSPYGALDMSGNVWEWTADFYGADYYANSPSQNPTGPAFGTHRVVRGGGWNSGSQNIRISNRDVSNPKYYNSTLGFRCARTAP